LDEGGGATFEERELLDAGRRAALPNALRRRVWLGVATGAVGIGAASEAAGALGSAGATKGAFSALIGSVTAKGVLAVALVGGAGLGVATLRSSSEPAAVATVARVAPARDVPPAVESRAPREENAGAPIRETKAPVSVPLPKPRTASPRPSSAAVGPSDDEARAREAPAESRSASRLREESAAVLAVRKTLLAGDAALALRMLDRARAEFPNGALAEEREALAVRALVTSGQNELARKRGEAFLHAFPRSPHASEVRAVLGP
jgi:hypothetical protein